VKHVNTEAIPIRKEKLIFINTGIKCIANKFLKENRNTWQCHKMGKHLHYCSSKFSAHISAVTLIQHTKNIWNLFPLPYVLVHHIIPPQEQTNISARIKFHCPSIWSTFTTVVVPNTILSTEVFISVTSNGARKVNFKYDTQPKLKKKKKTYKRTSAFFCKKKKKI